VHILLVQIIYACSGADGNGGKETKVNHARTCTELHARSEEYTDAFQELYIYTKVKERRGRQKKERHEEEIILCVFTKSSNEVLSRIYTAVYVYTARRGSCIIKIIIHRCRNKCKIKSVLDLRAKMKQITVPVPETDISIYTMSA
jgi:hypothetical protein